MLFDATVMDAARHSKRRAPVAISQAPVWIDALPCRVAAGSPSPVEDHIVQGVQSMEQLVRHHKRPSYLLCGCEPAIVLTEPTAALQKRVLATGSYQVAQLPSRQLPFVAARFVPKADM